MTTSTSSTESVRLFTTSGDTPVMVHAQLTSQDDQTVTVQSNQNTAGLSSGDRVVLAFDSTDRGRISGTIRGITDVDGGQQIEVTRADQHDRDKRDFPRLFAGLPIRYRIAEADLAAAWLDGASDPDEGWHSPDPFMNFSVGGLRFEADLSVEANDLLLVDFAVGEAVDRWRLTARVIRVFDPEMPESSTRPVAVAFVQIPDGAQEALSDLTLKIQDHLL